MSETNIVQECRLAASEMGATLFRNNCGAYKDNKGYYIKYGVGNPGGCDLIGWTKDGKFLGIECKVPGKHPTLEQTNFINAVIKAGGIAGVCRCKKDVIDLLTLDA